MENSCRIPDGPLIFLPKLRFPRFCSEIAKILWEWRPVTFSAFMRKCHHVCHANRDRSARAYPLRPFRPFCPLSINLQPRPKSACVLDCGGYDAAFLLDTQSSGVSEPPPLILPVNPSPAGAGEGGLATTGPGGGIRGNSKCCGEGRGEGEDHPVKMDCGLWTLARGFCIIARPKNAANLS